MRRENDLIKVKLAPKCNLVVAFVIYLVDHMVATNNRMLKTAV